ncbi:uncharacterized protein LOC129317716 isoform X2 [Prosopis cineraria]|uniref:uncharacterized protein LOC129317716 isoform X2 n=1 Tax=Prosopis cineraria TaxID=364024 RepID=UPI00240F783B|nr:uncharacterized protein LOC129317716 isoform X2 [Prosopis cineraria]
MQTPSSLHKISVTWRGKRFVIEMNSGATVKELGEELQKLTNIQEDTMRLIIPLVSSKASKLMSPFSAEHAFLSLHEASITEAKSIKMMGVSANEVEQVLQDTRVNLRIAGFEDEEKRLKQRSSFGPVSLKLPQGPYIFSEFRTLEIPGMELNPPPSEALKRMHMLAADPGIVAIMNKHRWHVVIMTEMAPIGYVGVSPKCILGFNKNHGEEISLRLRTDDLKGFRKYESIKKTLLHELAHMVYSEHDANFYALDKQLNQEATSLDWTKSAGNTLGDVRSSDYFEEDFERKNSNVPQKVGGNRSDLLASARASSVAAAYYRMTNASAQKAQRSAVNEEPDSDDSSLIASDRSDHMNSESKEIMDMNMISHAERGPYSEPDPDDHVTKVMKHEPDPDESNDVTALSSDGSNSLRSFVTVSVGPQDIECKNSEEYAQNEPNTKVAVLAEPDPDDLVVPLPELSAMQTDEPDPDDQESERIDVPVTVNVGPQAIGRSSASKEIAHNGPNAEVIVLAEPDPDDVVVPPPELSTMQIDEPDPDDQELQRINDPVTDVCNRLQKTLEVLRAEASPLQTASVLQTLIKIIRNVIEHPDEMKYKKLRKANPVIETNVVNNKAALEILFLVGFKEDVMFDELGQSRVWKTNENSEENVILSALLYWDDQR